MVTTWATYARGCNYYYWCAACALWGTSELALKWISRRIRVYGCARGRILLNSFKIARIVRGFGIASHINVYSHLKCRMVLASKYLRAGLAIFFTIKVNILARQRSSVWARCTNTYLYILASGVWQVPYSKDCSCKKLINRSRRSR